MSLDKPLFVLAPMANITTYPFASQCAEFGADLVWTPMVHTDTILNNWSEAEKILNFKEIDNYIIQLVGSEPEKFSQAIAKIEKAKLKNVGYDLNAGCPDKNIVKSGCGGALLKDPNKIVAIVEAMQSATKKPISVKTRLGYDNDQVIFDLAPKLADAGISMLTIHPRTVKQAYAGQADWAVINKICNLAHDNWSMAVIGSGDIKTWREAQERQAETGCDGVMIGRGALGRPWIFEEIRASKDITKTPAEIKELALSLAEKMGSIWGNHGIVESRKHFAWYFRGFDGAKDLRMELMQAESLEDVKKALDK